MKALDILYIFTSILMALIIVTCIIGCIALQVRHNLGYCSCKQVETTETTETTETIETIGKEIQ